MYPELISSKQAPWNKCLILWPVCTSLKTNRPLYEGQRTEITKPMRNKAHYQLLSLAEQKSQRHLNIWKSRSFQVSCNLPWLRAVTPNAPFGSLILSHPTMWPCSGLFLSPALHIVTFRLTVACVTQNSYKSHGVWNARNHELKILYELVFFKLFDARYYVNKLNIKKKSRWNFPGRRMTSPCKLD